MQEIYPNTTSALYITYIKLNLKLTNTSAVPIIFLQNEPIIKYAEVVQPEDENDIFLAETDGASSSFMMSSSDWKKLKTKLDKPKPNKETRIINPNVTIEFEGFVRLNIPKFQNEQPGIFRKISTLDFIQKQTSVKLKARCETWYTLSLFERSTEKKKKEFANKLRNKWAKFGYLWTKDIEIEPISIDFNSVIFKTLVN